MSETNAQSRPEGVAISIDNVSKNFKLPHEKQSSLKSALINFRKGKRGYENQKVLQNVSFEIKKGEFYGIVGRNGSGKSTLLKLLAGIYTPTKGRITVNGKLTPFIELGVGFNPELTGRENVYLNGALLGFSRKEMDRMYNEIVDFAELRRFMDQKLKNYSSGMQVRLAFSIAIRAESDILLIDEVLAVGDAVFQQKCYNYFKKLKKEKRTVVFVSHDTGALEEYCDRCILIEKGKVVDEGEPSVITKNYLDLLNQNEDQNSETVNKREKNRWGTGDIKVQKATLQSATRPSHKGIMSDEDKDILIQVSYKAQKDTEDPVFGISVLDSAGECIFQSNTMWNKVNTGRIKKGSAVEVEWVVPNIFNTGDLTVSPAAANRIGTIIYDWMDDMLEFKVRKTRQSFAHTNVPHSIKVKK